MTLDTVPESALALPPSVISNVMKRSVHKGPGSSSGEVLAYELDGPGSIPGVGGVDVILLHSFVSMTLIWSPLSLYKKKSTG